ncbi:hypothetical protein TrVGV298_009897 [Trichoderma virens]|nr:hypothetical protein TrVGV298_009897 [Trichoderma virens]
MRQQDPDFDTHTSMEDYRYEQESADPDYDDETMSQPDAADNGSHEGHDDDVFSDNSPRSSMGSMSEADPRKTGHDGLRSPRISDIQQYDEGEYAKTTPRSSLRSTSAKVTSPTEGSGIPRSGRRSALPTVSRLGSPSLSAQYSAKKTPPRFKKNDPPLVLLHVTLLPLRWAWGDVLDEAKTSELSEGVKTLREAWRQLQDTIGDTIQDRGVLLPHPQNDFEVMEERLLEALELPFKSRARILECGHYLGPSNEMPFADEHDSEDDDTYDDDRSARASVPKKDTHWCTTCSCEIPVDALGAGKIYRVKVYASNGLLRAGAWEACWKEMERVDIELEPMMDAKLQDELVHLAARQDRVIHSKSRAGRRRLSSRVQDVEDEREEEDFDETAASEGQESFMAQGRSASRRSVSYDKTSPAYREMNGGKSRSQEDAFGQNKTQSRFKAGSFPDMVVNAFKKLLDDKRNLAILLLSALTVVVALRGGVNNRFYDGIAPFQPELTESFETPTTVVTEDIGEGEAQVGEDGEDFSSTSGIENLFTSLAKNDGENPCAEPQTVEKWMTATVTQMSTVTRTDMPQADDDLFSEGDEEDEEDDEPSFASADGLYLGDGIMDEEELKGAGGNQGQSDWQWGSPFKFPW